MRSLALMVAMLVASNVLNLLLSVLLVYGPGEAPPVFSWGPPIARALHIPRMELVGAAWSTVLARTAVLLALHHISVDAATFDLLWDQVVALHEKIINRK